MKNDSVIKTKRFLHDIQYNMTQVFCGPPGPSQGCALWNPNSQDIPRAQVRE